MYTKNEHIDRFFEATSKNINTDGIRNYIDMGFIDGFQELLDNIAHNSKYSVGEQIIDSDLSRIQNAVNLTLAGMANMMIEQPLTLAQIQAKVGPARFAEIEALADTEKAEAIFAIEQEGKLPNKARMAYDPFPALVALNDHLYAMAMKTLGCPNIPEFFGTTTQDTIKEAAFQAEFKMKKADYRLTNTERIYEKQRGKDAIEVIAQIAVTQKALEEKSATPLRVAHYVGAYQALKKRQEGHGAIWKFFHKDENEARMTLLANMKKLLTDTLGDNIDVDKLTPIKVAKAYYEAVISDRGAKAFTEGALTERTQMPADSFQKEPLLTDRADKEKGNTGIDDEFGDDFRINMKFNPDEFKECEPYVEKKLFGLIKKVHQDNGKEIEFNENSEISEFELDPPESRPSVLNK